MALFSFHCQNYKAGALVGIDGHNRRLHKNHKSKVILTEILFILAEVRSKTTPKMKMVKLSAMATKLHNTPKPMQALEPWF